MAAHVRLDKIAPFASRRTLQFDGVAVDRDRDPMPSLLSAEPVPHCFDQRRHDAARCAQRDHNRPEGNGVTGLRTRRHRAGRSHADRLDVQLGEFGAQPSDELVTFPRPSLTIRKNNQRHVEVLGTHALTMPVPSADSYDPIILSAGRYRQGAPMSDFGQSSTAGADPAGGCDRLDRAWRVRGADAAKLGRSSTRIPASSSTPRLHSPGRISPGRPDISRSLGSTAINGLGRPSRRPRVP
jgi:hypothetical protein